MSNIYHTEPPTQGKVILKTSMGDIEIELWSREAPLACRNFIQLALEGYYDNCPVHRVIKDFMIQTGDPVNGDGTGGKSIWGRAFKDEIHGRIKFNHRGQVAMANENKPHSNHSQFFITLGPCDWLDRKHSIFGKVTGNTIYNVMRMGEVEVQQNERPIDDIKIVSVEVLWNPFDDIVPRATKAPPAADEGADAKTKAKASRKAVKDTKLLSFGEEAEELGESSAVTSRMHSSHDSKFKGSKLSSQIADELLPVIAEQTASGRPGSSSVAGGVLSKRETTRLPAAVSDAADWKREDIPMDFGEAMRLKMLEKRRAIEGKKGGESGVVGNSSSTGSMSSGTYHVGKTAYSDEKADEEQGEEKHLSKRDADLAAKSKEFQRLREDLLRSKRAVRVLTGEEAAVLDKDIANRDLLNPLQQRRQKFLKRKVDHGDRQDATMKKLSSFLESMRSSKAVAKEQPPDTSDIAEAYHGQVLEKGDDEYDDKDSSLPWHAGKLKFGKHIDDAYRLGKGSDGRLMDDYEVIDPRNDRSL